MREWALVFRTSPLGIMNSRTFLKRTALTCLSALCLAPGARADDAHVDFIPVPDPRTSNEATGSFAHQVLGVRIENLELPAGYNSLYVVAEQYGAQISHIRFTLDAQDPWAGQSMMRVYPNESTAASISVFKREHDSIRFSPVITVTHSQYYTSEDVQVSYDPEDPTLYFWIYPGSDEAYLPPIKAACSSRRCWEIRDDDVGVETKLTGPHD